MRAYHINGSRADPTRPANHVAKPHPGFQSTPRGVTMRGNLSGRRAEANLAILIVFILFGSFQLSAAGKGDLIPIGQLNHEAIGARVKILGEVLEVDRVGDVMVGNSSPQVLVGDESGEVTVMTSRAALYGKGDDLVVEGKLVMRNDVLKIDAEQGSIQFAPLEASEIPTPPTRNEAAVPVTEILSPWSKMAVVAAVLSAIFCVRRSFVCLFSS